MIELLFFWVGIIAGFILYIAIALIFILVAYRLQKEMKRHWLKIALWISRPFVDFLVFFLIVVVVLEVLNAFAEKNTAYIAGEVVVGCLPAAVLGLILDVAGGAITVARVVRGRRAE